MFAYLWPIALVVLSNVFYHICAKSVPDRVDPFATLIVTYLVGAVIALICFFIFNKGGNIFLEMKKINWASVVLGIVIVGLEIGSIYTYKAGWQISMASIVQNAGLAIVLLFVGFLLYKEALTWNKLVGIVICLVGLYFINYKG